MNTCSLMTGVGFTGGAFSMDWIMAWVGVLILTLCVMLGKKWLGEEEVAGIPFNWFGSGLGLIVYFLVVTLSCSYKWSLIGGLIGFAAGGFGAGQFFGGGSDNG